MSGNSALAQLTEQLAEAYRDRDALLERLTIADAQRTQLIAALSELIGYVRGVGGFMFAEEQATLRYAMAVLAEVQR